MKYDRIEGIDKDISKLVMGCDNQDDINEASKLWDHWIEVGGNMFDTAFIYGGGNHEKVLGQWLKNNNNRKDVLILSAPNMGKKVKVYTDEKKYEKNAQVLVECAGRSTTSNGGWSMGVLPGWNCGDEVTRWLSVYLNDTEKSTGRRSKPLATYVLVRACSKDAARHLST